MMKRIGQKPEASSESVYGGRSSSGDPMAGDHNDSWHTNNFAWGNARQRKPGYWNEEIGKKWEALTLKVQDQTVGCYNCPKDCIAVISYPGRQRNFIKCFNKLTYAMAAHLELDFSYNILAITQELGLDGYSTPLAVAFSLELYEAVVLTY